MSWATVFRLAAVSNLGVGLALLLVPHSFLGLLGAAPGPGFDYFERLTGLCVICFGYGYFIASREPDAHRDLVVLGALGKGGVAVLTTAQYLSGAIPAVMAAFFMGDLVFALAFAAFLVRGR